MMMNLNHYRDVLSLFLENRKSYPEEPARRVPVDTVQLPLGGVKVVSAAVMVFDIKDSTKVMEQMKNKAYMNWLGLALHLFFHCVDDYNGVVDKYTGDGAMVSFSLGSPEERCTNALNCALMISDILSNILNPAFKQRNYQEMRVRIGIDFGEIRIEKIGKKALTHLVIVGEAANFAKRLETYGNELTFYKGTTICIGYDCCYNLSENDCKDAKAGGYYLTQRGNFKGESEFDGKSPYPIYEYTARFTD